MDNYIDIIEKVAPELAKALQGPFAEIAKNFIIENIPDKDTTEGESSDDIIQELLSNYRNLNELKEINVLFVKELKSLNIDVNSLNNTTKTVSYESQRTPQFLLSLVFIFLYFIILAAILNVEFSDINNMKKGENSLIGEIEILIGVITGGVAQILSYWFGGSITKKSNSGTE